ncbi:MAG TPA: HDIG domain-containing protein [Anaerolineales bacterium]|nr:HDIG domain-containing protein [Anaerolineales bacterium]
MESPAQSPRFLSRQVILRTVVLVSVTILSYLALIQPWSLRQNTLPLAVGDVASQDLSATHDFQYVSKVLTDAARDSAERAVAPVYVPPDPSIARTQATTLSNLLQAISTIRSDDTTSIEQKKAALIVVPGFDLQPDSINFLLALPDARWSLVSDDAFNVLVETMRNPVRTENLDAVRQSLSTLVSFSLTDREAVLVVGLVSPLITANSFYSPELTDAARQAARAAVQPVTRSFLAGQTVVARGQVVTAGDLEALTALGLVQPKDPFYSLLGGAALVLLLAVFTALYFSSRQPATASDLRSVLLFGLLFIVFLAGARISIPNRTVMPYLFPVPAFALLVAALFGMERGMVFGLVMSVLCAYGTPDGLGLASYYTLSCLCGVLALGQARRIAQFLFAAVAIAVAGAAMIAAYRLPSTYTDWIGTATLVGAALIMGIASAGLALPLQFLLSQFIGMTTALQLLEISRPDSPLLSYFLQRAPGTYQHSLQVANLAEQAAERIHADALLTKVGALFHDVGKAANPLFFVENQPPTQIDSHNDLEPRLSAQTIIRHVPDGLELARKHHLPRRLQDFIAEHHGTLITRYQYNQAVQAADGDKSKVDLAEFQYPGPAPRSKETALLMFADGVEARSRAERPANDDEVRTLVRSVIENRQKEGQLDDAPLSQRDLAVIIESFVSTLRVAYHPRLEYPRESPAAVEVPAQPPPQQKTG